MQTPLRLAATRALWRVLPPWNLPDPVQPELVRLTQKNVRANTGGDRRVPRGARSVTATLTRDERLSELLDEMRRVPSLLADTTRAVEANIARLSGEIQNLKEGSERLLTLGLGILGAGAAYGVAQRQPVVLAVLPLPIALVGLWSLKISIDILSRGGQRRYLEVIVNSQHGAPIEVFEYEIVQLWRNTSERAASWLFALALAGTAAASAVGAVFMRPPCHPLNLWVLPIEAALILVTVKPLWGAWLEATSAYDVAYAAARDCWDFVHEPPRHG